MRIYVATSFLNIAEALDLMHKLEVAGHRITHNWTQERPDESWDAERRNAYMQKCGRNDYIGVRKADAVVLINHDKARDAMAEMGIAMGMEKPVYVLYPERRISVFFHRATMCSTIPELLARLENNR